MPRGVKRRNGVEVEKQVKEDEENRNGDEGPSRPKSRRTNICLPVPELPKEPGILLVCGQGDMGQLGLGEDEMEKSRPALLSSVENVVDIKAGGMHSLCLINDGKVYSFGCNDEGALGRDTSEEGSEFTPGVVNLPGKCVKISAGDSHSACLLEDGRVFAWGSFRDSHGSMGLTAEGAQRLPIEIAPELRACDIGSGADHLAILTTSGELYTMGCGEQGQLGRVSLRNASGETRRGKKDLLIPGKVVMKRNKRIQKLWTTIYSTFVEEMFSDSIQAFGLNNYEQLGIKKSNMLVVNPTKCDFENVQIISGGQHHTLVLKTDKKCYTIGRKDYGRLGLGDLSEDVKELTIIKDLEKQNVTNICCGECQSFAVTVDGKLYSWGMGSNSQLGTGKSDDELVPILVEGKQLKERKVIKVSSGGQHTLILASQDIIQNKKNPIQDITKEGSTNGESLEIVENNAGKNLNKNSALVVSNKGRKKKT